jgi:hypothetical protein
MIKMSYTEKRKRGFSRNIRKNQVVTLPNGKKGTVMWSSVGGRTSVMTDNGVEYAWTNTLLDPSQKYWESDYYKKQPKTKFKITYLVDEKESGSTFIEAPNDTIAKAMFRDQHPKLVAQNVRVWARVAQKGEFV